MPAEGSESREGALPWKVGHPAVDPLSPHSLNSRGGGWGGVHGVNISPSSEASRKNLQTQESTLGEITGPEMWPLLTQ